MSDRIVRASKFLSLILRHQPETIGLTVDSHGWASVDDLIACSQNSRMPLARELIEEVVETNDKKRYAFSADGARIRAVQGHSLPVTLDLESLTPPDRLYHGTATRFVAVIRKEGLVRQSRHHVHLSLDAETATTVGARHGTPVVLVVLAKELHEFGQQFFRSENGVWLTDWVPPEYLEFPE